MKPIIIAIENGKVAMPVEQFKKFIEDAYYQGYNDGTSLTSSTSNNPYWWRDITCGSSICDTVTLNTTEDVNGTEYIKDALK